MTANEWASLTIGAAAVIAALAAVPTIKYRKPGIITSITLLVVAVIIAINTGASPTVTGTTTSPTATATNSVDTSGAAFSKQLTIPLFNNYTSIDLSAARVHCCTGYTDLYYDREAGGRLRIRPAFGAFSANVPPGPVTGSVCQDAINTRPTAIPVTSLNPGSRICATSGTNGIGLLEVLSAPDSNGTFTAQLTYWSG